MSNGLDEAQSSTEDLRTRREKDTAGAGSGHSDRLRGILKLLHRINQLILAETEHQSLLDEVCQALVTSRGYPRAWMAALDADAQITVATHVVQTTPGEVKIERLAEQSFPSCGLEALSRPEILSEPTPRVDCSVCGSYPEARSGTSLVIRLEHLGRVHGVMCVVLPDELAEGSEERALLEGLAGQVALLLHHHEVSEERRRVRQQLITARDSAQTASQAKSDFLSHMSHEIRTPMNALAGMAELLLDTELDSRQRIYAKTLAGSAAALMKLLDDILDLSRVEAGRLALESVPFDLLEIAQQVQALHGPMADEKLLSLDIRMVPDAPRFLYGDPGRLRQVLNNLVGNAIKFTERGRVRLAIDGRPARSGCNEVLIEVKDTGIGIKPDQQESIFEMFTQADRPSEQIAGGSGLGLAVCRQLVELMGGTIELESTPGRGSTFLIRLLLESAEESKIVRTERTPVPRSFDARVLVAEDSRANRLVACGMLARFGCRAEAVVNGRQAVERIREESFDLILMDCSMPEMDGYSATRAIRALPEPTRAIPIVAMTAHAMSGDRERCLDSGMDDYLAKPVSTADLGQMLARYCKPSSRSVGRLLWHNSIDQPLVEEPMATSDDAEKVLDTTYLPRVLGGSMDVLREAVASFLEDSPALLEELRSVVAAADTDAVYRASHAIAGAAAMVGGQQLSKIAFTIETAAQEGQPQQCQDLLAVLQEGYDLLCQRLRSTDWQAIIDGTC